MTLASAVAGVYDTGRKSAREDKMEKNCSDCYFYDDVNHKEKTIYCRLWQKRRSQYDSCSRWEKHRNDPKHIVEMEAKRIRDEIEKKEQYKTAKERHKESVGLQKRAILIGILALIIAIVTFIYKIYGFASVYGINPLRYLQN